MTGDGGTMGPQLICRQHGSWEKLLLEDRFEAQHKDACQLRAGLDAMTWSNSQLQQGEGPTGSVRLLG